MKQARVNTSAALCLLALALTGCGGGTVADITTYIRVVVIGAEQVVKVIADQSPGILTPDQASKLSTWLRLTGEAAVTTSQVVQGTDPSVTKFTKIATAWNKAILEPDFRATLPPQIRTAVDITSVAIAAVLLIAETQFGVIPGGLTPPGTASRRRSQAAAAVPNPIPLTAADKRALKELAKHGAALAKGR